MVVTATVHETSLPAPLAPGVTMGHVATAIANRAAAAGWGYIVTRVTDVSIYFEVTIRDTIVHGAGEVLTRGWGEGPAFSFIPFDTVRQMVLHVLNEVTVALTPVATGDTVTGA